MSGDEDMFSCIDDDEGPEDVGSGEPAINILPNVASSVCMTSCVIDAVDVSAVVVIIGTDVDEADDEPVVSEEDFGRDNNIDDVDSLLGEISGDA